MNPNDRPVGPNAPIQPSREFTDKALEAKFSYSFTRRQIILLVGILRQQTFALGSPQRLYVGQVLDEFENTAIQSLTDSDYKTVKEDATPAVNVN